MPGRAGGGQAFVPQSPAPSALFLIPSPTTYHIRPTNYLSFQQHSRFKQLRTFVFIDIPASWPSFPQRSFVFNDIPVSFVRFLKLLVLSFPDGGDILSRGTMPAKNLLHPASLKCSGQSAVGSRQRASVAQVPLSGPAGLQRQQPVGGG